MVTFIKTNDYWRCLNETNHRWSSSRDYHSRLQTCNFWLEKRVVDVHNNEYLEINAKQYHNNSANAFLGFSHIGTIQKTV